MGIRFLVEVDGRLARRLVVDGEGQVVSAARAVAPRRDVAEDA